MTILKRFPLAGAWLALVLLLGFSPAPRADEFLDATRLFKQGQHAQALGKVNNFLANKPRDAQGRFLKGLILTEKGETADAIRIFSDLTVDFPYLPEPYNNLAVLYASQSQYDKAKSALEMAIRTHPSYATAHENLGDIYAKMASQAYDRALQLDSGNTSTQTKLAMIQDLFSEKSRGRTPALRNPATAANNKPFANLPDTKPPAKPLVTAAQVSGKLPLEAIPTPAVSDKARDLQETVEAWAHAWSAQNVKQYLSFYAADFKTPNGESRKTWAETRKDRISRPKHIEVNVSKFKVDFDDNSHATVKFYQNYHASGFKASGGKTLRMVKSGGSWFIQEEWANQ